MFDGLGKQFTADFLALDGNLVHAGDADETERSDQVRLQMVHMRHLSAGIEADAAARREDHRMARPVGQPGCIGIERVAFIHVHCAAGAHHLVDPRLERGGHAEWPVALHAFAS